MCDRELRHLIQQTVEHRAKGYTIDPYLAQRVIAKGKENPKMKKKLSFIIVLMLVLLLITATAFAVSHLDAFKAIWENSFQRMNTTGTIDAVPMEEFDLASFEKEYSESFGLDRKEDLVLSTVPEDQDLPFEEAYVIAKQAIMDTFGTPEAEIDAMGVYPTYYKTVYNDSVSEWSLYFSPRTHTDLEADHDYAAPGEYRVSVLSPSGEVTICVWYLDEFFPKYAQRSWDAGKYDYVYQKATQYAATNFFTISKEEQAHFLRLFEEKGFDISPLQKADSELLKSMEMTLRFAPLEENLLHTDTPGLSQALIVMEQQFGLTPALMDSLCMVCLPSPASSDTLDFCFSYNFNAAQLIYDHHEPHRGIQALVSAAPRYTKLYMVSLEPQTLTVLEIHSAAVYDRKTTGHRLLEKAVWEKEDMKDAAILLLQLTELDKQNADGTLDDETYLIRIDETMRSFGGSEEKYPRKPLKETDLQQKEAEDAAFAALATHLSSDTESLKNTYFIRSLYESSVQEWCIIFYQGNPSDESTWQYAYQVNLCPENGEVVRLYGPEDTNG